MGNKKPKQAKDAEPQYPSMYGSHQSMIIRRFADFVYCLDARGIYRTDNHHIDSGLADINRYDGRP